MRPFSERYNFSPITRGNEKASFCIWMFIYIKHLNLCLEFTNLSLFQKHTPAAIKYSPAKINVGRSLSSFGNSNNQLGECSSVSSPRTSTNSEPSDLQPSKFSLVKLENTQQCSSASKSVDDKKSNEPLCVSSSAGGGPNLSDNGYSPGADAGNLPLTDVPFTNSGGDPLEKMARLTQETLPFEPPLVCFFLSYI